MFSDVFGLRPGHSGDQDCEQQKPQPSDKASEVVSGGGEHGIDGVACGVGEIVAAHAMVVLEMADDRLDGGAAFLAGSVNAEPMLGRSIVTAVGGIGDDAVEHDVRRDRPTAGVRRCGCRDGR